MSNKRMKLISRLVPERQLWAFTGSVATRLMRALTAGSGLLLESGLPPALVRAFCLPLWSAHGFCYRIACFSIEQRKLLLSRREMARSALLRYAQMLTEQGAGNGQAET